MASVHRTESLPGHATGHGMPAPPATVHLPTAPGWLRVVCLLGMVAVVIWLGRTGAKRLSPRQDAQDFEYFYNAGAWLLHHGMLDPGYDVEEGRLQRRGRLDWYWPFVSRLMALLAWLPFKTAGYVWLGLNLVALVALVRLIGRYMSGLPPEDWPVTQLVPLMLLAAYWSWEFRLNQINTLTLLLMVGSFVCWQRGARSAAGLWIGLAVLLKITPGLLVVWYALKRQYRTTAVAFATVLLAGPVSDAIVFGPETAWQAYRGWQRRAVHTGSHAGLIRTEREMDWRNQGMGAVLARWLHDTDYSTHFDNDPRIQTKYAAEQPQTLNVANWSLSGVATLATGISLGSLLVLILLARRPAARMPVWSLRFEFVLFMLAMLWLMPVMRRYHMIWALPAVSLLGAGLHYMGWRGLWSWLTLGCLLAVLGGQVGLLWRPLEAAGVVLVSVLVLMIPVITLLRKLARDPAALPPPALGDEIPLSAAEPRQAGSTMAKGTVEHA